MKKLFRPALIVATLVLALTPAFAQFSSPPPLISVSGSAEVKVAPDEIFLSVGVESRDENLETAKHDNDDRIAKALAFLKKNGVDEKDVQTDYINIEPGYDNNYSRTRPIVYTVRKSIQIKLTKMGSFETVLTGLLDNGVNNVSGIEFRTTELRKYRDQARAMAVRAAKEKADAMASELGVKCGKVNGVNANEYGGWFSPGGGGNWGGRLGGGGFQNAVQSAGGASEDSGTFSTGQISVSASVNVSFLIQ